MALLERVSTLVRANLNDLIDKAEHPEKMIKQVILDMQNQFLQVKTQVAIAIADQHLLEKKQKENEDKVAEWMRKAELSVDKKHDDLARAALQRAESYRDLSEGFAQQVADQKAQAEYALSEALSDQSDAWCIVRLTKVLAPHTPPLPHWSRDLSAGRPIHPFADLIFAPISCQFAARALVRVAEARLPGRFHLSGKENLSYADFAIQTVAAMGLPAELVQPTTAVAAGVRIAFQPRFSALGMARTEARLDIAPQPADSVVADLLA